MEQNNSLLVCLERHYALQPAAGENLDNFRLIKQHFHCKNNVLEVISNVNEELSWKKSGPRPIWDKHGDKRDLS